MLRHSLPRGIFQWFHLKKVYHFHFGRRDQSIRNPLRRTAPIIKQLLSLSNPEVPLIRTTGPFFRPTV